MRQPASTSGGPSIFDPAIPLIGENRVKFNPLEEIRVGTQWEAGDIRAVAEAMLTSALATVGTPDRECAIALLVMTIERAFNAKRDKSEKVNVADVIAVFESDADFDDGLGFLRRALESRQVRHNTAAYVFASLLPYVDPIVAANTVKSDFSLSEVVAKEDPLVIYVVVRGFDIARLRPLVVTLKVLARRAKELASGNNESKKRFDLFETLNAPREDDVIF